MKILYRVYNISHNELDVHKGLNFVDEFIIWWFINCIKFKQEIVSYNFKMTILKSHWVWLSNLQNM
jgi:hypothetical protein